MSSITLQILEGHERGRTFSDLEMPITIGREEDNQIRLNDERASRFHAKIQADDDRIILTDLDSTNGTRVNGHNVSVRILQAGDQILIGRSLIAYWPTLEDALSVSGSTPGDGERLASVGDGGATSDRSGGDDDHRTADGTLYRGSTMDAAGSLFPDGPPELPRRLSPAQRAELSDVLSFVQQGLLSVAVTSYSGEAETTHGEHMVVPASAWRQFTAVQRALAEYLAKASQPDAN